MKSYTIKNKAKRPIVCSLKDGSTLRLLVEGESTLTEDNLTSNIKNLVNRGLVLITPIVIRNQTKKVVKETIDKEKKKED